MVAKTQSLYRENVDWHILEKEIYENFIVSDSITSIIEPVQYLLTELGDFHGTLFLNGQHFKGNVPRTRNVSYDYQGQDYINQTSSIFQNTLNQDSIKGFLTEHRIAYIEIPMMMPYGGSEDEVIKNAKKIREKICELKTQKPIGWIVDLRGNLGGNMHPMLMGLAELLPLNMDMGGNSYDGKSIGLEWKLKNGVFYDGEYYNSKTPKLICNLKNSKEKIGVLVGRYTQSSGEVVASTLKGQNNIKLFGEQTAGATTANIWTPIGNKVVFNPAVSYYVSKDKTIHKDGITPDILIDENFDYKKPISGKVFEEAERWLIKKSE